ncbi:MAG: NAD(P)-dependent oxidoreductase [Nitrospira sp.]|nr:MAG: NAD(P)-dependent oxidoreductase [Nitrospira sp.]
MSASDESKRVLVTGATGFIGSHCLVSLVQRGYEVHAISTKLVMKAESSIVWHQADLLDESSGVRLMESVKPTHLLHLAWYVVPGKLISSDLNFDWVHSSMKLLRAFQQQGGRRVVMSGSSYEYDWNYGYCHEARTPKIPNTVYGACKHALDVMVQAFCLAHGISQAWPRVFFLYGPNEHPDRLVSSVIRSLLQGAEARCSHGKQIRDYLHVQDVAEAIVSVLDCGVEGAVNIGSGTAVTLREMIVTIGRTLGQEDLLKLGAIPSRANDAPLVVADVERLINEVKWQPRFSMEEGLKHTIEWWRHTLAQNR